MDDHPLPELALDLLRCIECRDAWIDGADRWRAYLTEDPKPELVFYCSACASREFD